MRLSNIIFIYFQISVSIVEAGVEDFIKDFVENNNHFEYSIVGSNSSEFSRTISKANLLASKILSTDVFNIENPRIFIGFPENVSHGLIFLRNISKFYSSKPLAWKPIFFLIWPVDEAKELSTIVTDLLTSSLSLSNLDLNLDSDIFLILETNSKKIHVLEIYYLKETLRVEEVILESHARKTELMNYLPKAVHRENFKGANILAIGLGDPDYEYQCKLEDINGTVRFLSGIAVDILHALQYSLNFSYTAIKGEGWIEQLENGTWTGMARQIRSGDGDLGISQSTFVPYRLAGLGFLHPTSFGHVKAFFRQPPASSIRDVFITPFGVDLWICLLIICGLLIGSMFSIYWVRIKCIDELVDIQDEEMVHDSFLWTIATLCQQGWHFCPASLSLKIVLLSGSVLGLVYYVAFSAALVSTLSVDIVPIRSIEDLAHSNLEIWGDFWIPNKYGLVQSILDKRKKVIPLPESEQYLEIDHAMPKLIKKSSAFLTFADGFLTVFNRLNYSDQFYCDTFSSVGVMKAPHLSGMIVQKGSPYKEIFNHKILLMRERGLNTRFNNHYGWGTLAMCPRKTSQYRDKLGILDVFTAYLVLIGGFCMSSACILIEFGVFALFAKSGLEVFGIWYSLPGV